MRAQTCLRLQEIGTCDFALPAPCMTFVKIKRIIGNQLPRAPFLADGGAICLNRTEGWNRG
jgi:hypothetical protein